MAVVVVRATRKCSHWKFADNRAPRHGDTALLRGTANPRRTLPPVGAAPAQTYLPAGPPLLLLRPRHPGGCGEYGPPTLPSVRERALDQHDELAAGRGDDHVPFLDVEGPPVTVRPGPSVFPARERDGPREQSREPSRAGATWPAMPMGGAPTELPRPSSLTSTSRQT